jgi:hypothetical protein
MVGLRLDKAGYLAKSSLAIDSQVELERSLRMADLAGVILREGIACWRPDLVDSWG